MSFCIVILSYNHPELTRKTIDSAISFNHKIILVHNGSEKKNVEYLKEHYSFVDHFIIDKNEGYSGGVNQGLHYAFKKYQWVLLLTNDTSLLEMNSLEDEIFKEPAQIAPIIYFRKMNKVDSIAGLFYPKKAHLEHLKENRAEIPKGAYLYVPGTAFYLHREVFYQVGNFDQSLHTYWEDVDFSVRIQHHHLPIKIDLNTKILHKVGKTCHQDLFYTTFLFKRNRRIVSFRYTKPLEKIQLTLILIIDFFKALKVFYKTQNQKRFSLYLKALFKG